MKFYLLFALLFTTPMAIAQKQPEHMPIQLCAQTADGKIRLVLDTAKQTVRYIGKNQAIPLVFQSERLTRTVPSRPSEFEYRWQERYQGKATGEYRYRLMGVNFYQFRYINYRNQKVIDFENVFIDQNNTGCPHSLFRQPEH